MTAKSSTLTTLSGDYRVTRRRRGKGIDYYLTVVGPDGRSTEQKVYWTYSLTPFQVAEKAVRQHLGHDDLRLAAPTREDINQGGYLVTLG